MERFFVLYQENGEIKNYWWTGELKDFDCFLFNHPKITWYQLWEGKFIAEKEY